METKEIKIDRVELLARVARLQKDINFIKEHIEDITLTEDDLESLEKAEKEFREGKTKKLEDLKKESGI